MNIIYLLAFILKGPVVYGDLDEAYRNRLDQEARARCEGEGKHLKIPAKYTTVRLFGDAKFLRGEYECNDVQLNCSDCCADVVWGHKFCMNNCQQHNGCGF